MESEQSTKEKRIKNPRIINVKKVKELVRSTCGKRTSLEFIAALDKHVQDLITKAASVHDGSAKTLNVETLFHVAG